MPTCPLLADRWAPVKSGLLEQASAFLDELGALASQADFVGQRVLEMRVWTTLVAFGATLLSQLLSLACLAQTVQHPAFDPHRCRLRADRGYRRLIQSTLGALHVLTGAFRDANGRTVNPGRGTVLPEHARVRATDLLVEWSSRLGAEMPFRNAQDALAFFTHGAVTIEDNTLQRQAQLAGALVTRRDCFRTPQDIARVLRDKATRDTQTGRPLLYASTDAHALRRYVDDTCNAPWKMINGVRVWCIDAKTGRIIHLGGDYTWGDADTLEELFRDLRDEGWLPADGRLGDLEVQVVVPLDGQDWLRDRWKPYLPKDTQFILDFYHVLQNVAAFLSALYGVGSKKAKRALTRVFRILAGRRRPPRRTRKKRGGTRKRRARHRRRRVTLSTCDGGAGFELIQWLLENHEATAIAKDLEDEFDVLVAYIDRNVPRLDFPTYQRRGLQIGSGAMESLHRQASQVRLKRPGARWLPQNALGILRLRLMALAGRWEAFWAAPGRCRMLHTPSPDCSPMKQLHAA